MVADLLLGWLTGTIAFGAVPAGSLVLLLMMRLIPGAWGEQLRLSAEAATLLVPAAALAMVPVLLGLRIAYPWGLAPPANAFQRIWLDVPTYLACTLLWFGAQGWIAQRTRRRRSSIVTAACGLLVLVPLSFLVGLLWVLSLDPGFASSAFGLQFLLTLVVIGFTALVLLRLTTGRVPVRLEVIGGLLLTLALLGGYFQFLPFFIAWSENLVPGARWYLVRAANGWQVAIWAFALLGGWPLLALLLKPVRQSRRWLIAVSASMLIGKLVELGWFILPGRGPAALLAAPATLLLFGALTAWLLPRALAARIAARSPQVTA